MAYRAGSVTTYITNSQTTTSVVINSPVGVSSGDIVVIGLLTHNTNAVPMSSTGFTVGDSQSAAYGSYGPALGIAWLYKVAGGSEPSTYTVTINAAYYDDMMAFCAAWTGRNTTTPITDHSYTKTGGSNSPVTMTLTGVTAAAGDDLIFISEATQGASCVWTAPASFTTGAALQTPASNYGNAYFAYRDAVGAGATGTISASEVGVQSDRQGFVIALAAGASPGIVVAWLHA